MVDLLYVSIATTYQLVFAVLYVYGMNYLYLGWLAWRRRRARHTPPAVTSLPTVTVQIPLYNERYVAERVIEAAARLDYPAELLEIQVLDDSTDETVGIVSSAAERLRRQGVRVSHLHRTHRTGFKAGALAAGLAQARGEFIALLDGDFVPMADFLRRTIPHFQDGRLAFVQARWGHLNRDYSLLTLMNSLQIDAEFMAWQFARHHGGYWFHFNGSAGVWRRTAIDDAGGWSADTLTEDMDLSYRAFLRGWRALYLRDIEVPAELPTSFTAYRRQQHRWACGSLECALRLLPRIWRAPTTVPIKLQATLQLTGFCTHLLLFVLAVMSPLVVLLPIGRLGLFSAIGLGPMLVLPMIAPALFLFVSQQQLGRRWWRLLPLLPLVTPLGTSMMLNTVRAAVQALRRRPGVFERTPKLGVVRKAQGPAYARYGARLDPIVVFEAVLALVNLWASLSAFRAGNPFVAVLSATFCQVLLFASCWTIAHTIVLPGWRSRSDVQPLADTVS